jgi:iron(III) transport system substrate-binding protein
MRTQGSRRRSGALSRTTVFILVIVGAALAYAVFWRRAPGTLVVYCAHDSVYSESVLKDFERASGIPVAIKFDTEATKSLGLVEQIIRERTNPRCDVFWNNEILGTMKLRSEGLLQPYRGDGYERVPPRFRDPDGYWAGFGARMRVYIINTDQIEPTEKAVRETLAGDLSHVAIARPLYGTTLTQYCVLYDALGMDGLRAWHDDMRARGIREVTGNAQVKNLVGKGVCSLGFTDSDDYFGAKDEGLPVAELPVRTPDGGTICIPNTLSIVQGSGNPEAAERLVDYLLSAEVELRLAQSRARQIPLGLVDETQLPEEVKQLREWVADAVPLTDLLPARRACEEWLKNE